MGTRLKISLTLLRGIATLVLKAKSRLLLHLLFGINYADLVSMPNFQIINAEIQMYAP